MEEVANLAMDTLGNKVTAALKAPTGSGDTDDIQQACLQIIASITRKIQAFLNRKLIINLSDTFFTSGGCWKKANEFMVVTDTDQKWRNYWKQFPVVQVVSLDNDTDLADEAETLGNRKEYCVVTLAGDLTQLPTRGQAFAGYRRLDQDPPGSGETWNGVMDTTDLTLLDNDAVVELLPDDINEVATTCVIAMLRWQYKGLIGVTESTLSGDRLTMTNRKALDNYIQKQIESLHNHRVAPF